MVASRLRKMCPSPRIVTISVFPRNFCLPPAWPSSIGRCRKSGDHPLAHDLHVQRVDNLGNDVDCVYTTNFSKGQVTPERFKLSGPTVMISVYFKEFLFVARCDDHP